MHWSISWLSFVEFIFADENPEDIEPNLFNKFVCRFRWRIDVHRSRKLRLSPKILSYVTVVVYFTSVLYLKNITCYVISLVMRIIKTHIILFSRLLFEDMNQSFNCVCVHRHRHTLCNKVSFKNICNRIKVISLLNHFGAYEGARCIILEVIINSNIQTTKNLWKSGPSSHAIPCFPL